MNKDEEAMWDRLKYGIETKEDMLWRILHEECQKEWDAGVIDDLKKLAAKDDECDSN